MQVGLQVATLSEPLVTHVASEWLFACVDTHVHLQVATMSEPLVAHLTLERSFSDVCDHVRF